MPPHRVEERSDARHGPGIDPGPDLSTSPSFSTFPLLPQTKSSPSPCSTSSSSPSPRFHDFRQRGLSTGAKGALPALQFHSAVIMTRTSSQSPTLLQDIEAMAACTRATGCSGAGCSSCSSRVVACLGGEWRGFGGICSTVDQTAGGPHGSGYCMCHSV